MREKGYAFFIFYFAIWNNLFIKVSSYCILFVAEEFYVLQFPITAIREIKILKKLQHDNVIQLKEIVTSPGCSPDNVASLSISLSYFHPCSSCILLKQYFLKRLSDYVPKTLSRSWKRWARKARFILLFCILSFSFFTYLIYEWLSTFVPLIKSIIRRLEDNLPDLDYFPYQWLCHGREI